jgi:hypothetical protein
MIVFATQDFVLTPEICEVRTVSGGFVACCANRTTDCGQMVGPEAIILSFRFSILIYLTSGE